MAQYSFDTILIDPGTGFRPVSIDEWHEMPRPERFEFILAGSIRFLRGDQVIPTRDALAEINGQVR